MVGVILGIHFFINSLYIIHLIKIYEISFVYWENMLYLRWAVLNVGWCVVLVRRIIIWDMMIIAWE